jgi:hypothetical protein
MNRKGYLKAVPIRNILQIGINQYDEWVEKGLDLNQPLVRVEVSPEINAELEKRGITHPNELTKLVEMGLEITDRKRKNHDNKTETVA